MDAGIVIDIAEAYATHRSHDRAGLMSLSERELLAYLEACETASRDAAGHVRDDALSREQDRIVAELRRRRASVSAELVH